MNLKLPIRTNTTTPKYPSPSQKEPTTVTTEEKQRSNINVFIDAACPICQEPVGQRTPEGQTESWSKLPCGHKFGSHCIKHWLGMVAEERPCCPICRQNASYGCGHPVLPQLIKSKSKDNRAAAREETGGVVTTAEMRGAIRRPPETFKDTWCSFCRHAVNRGRKKKRLKPWRFVKGCWRLVLTGRMREQRQQAGGRLVPAPGGYPAGTFAYLPGYRQAEFQKWWREQEPRGA
ncbi:hypothetical protein GE09DRAFT_597306 [Coniochaeta sp. 2T2.1]|nr:hypothetical protein GE09DRAFT_597306 [Coniochaeta sp. 2T2.1]